MRRMYVPLPGLEIAIERWWTGWVLRGRVARARYAADGSGWVLTYTTRYRVTMVVLFAVVTTLYVLAYRDGDVFGTSTWRAFGLLVGSGLLWVMFGAFVVASLIERVAVTPQHLRRRSWRGRQQIAWSNVNLLRIDQKDHDLKIGVEGGPVIEVSFYLDGLSAIADALQRQLIVSPDLFDAVIDRGSAGAS
jgi:hypothetical protein